MKRIVSLCVVSVMMLSTVFTAGAAKAVNFKKTYTVGLHCAENLKLPWNGSREYSFKVSNKKVLKKLATPHFNDLYSGDYCYVPFRGMKTGKVTVKVYQKKKQVGQFTVRVNRKTPKMPKKTYKMKYSPNGLTEKSTLLAVDKYNGKMRYYNQKAKYKMKSSDKAVATVKDGVVTTSGVGTAKISIYETYNKKTRKVSSFEVVSTAAKMNAVVKYNRSMYDDGLFGKGEFVEYLYLKEEDGGKTLDMQKVIYDGLLSRYDAKFAAEDYSVTYKSDNEQVVSVSAEGLATALAVGSAKVTYTIQFSDGSSFEEKVAFEVE